MCFLQFKKTQGYTLIELLVVITIIGIISLVATVQYQNYRDRARIAKAQKFEGGMRASLGLHQTVSFYFEDLSGGVVDDVSGLGNDGTALGSPTLITDSEQCIDGNCLEFDGIDDTVIIPDNSYLSDLDELTIALWIYFSEEPDNTDKIVEKNNEYALLITNWMNDWYPFFSITGASLDCPAANMELNKWYHLVVSWKENERIDFYIDGANLCGTTLAGTSSDQSSSLAIGSNSFGSQFFKGKMDQVRIFDISLKSDQVAQLYEDQNITYVKRGNNPKLMQHMIL